MHQGVSGVFASYRRMVTNKACVPFLFSSLYNNTALGLFMKLIDEPLRHHPHNILAIDTYGCRFGQRWLVIVGPFCITAIVEIGP